MPTSIGAMRTQRWPRVVTIMICKLFDGRALYSYDEIFLFALPDAQHLGNH